MSNQEKIHTSPESSNDTFRDLDQHHSESLRKKHEKAGEFSPESNETSSDRARVEALENAVSVEKAGHSKEKPSTTRVGTINKRELDTTYKQTMQQVQSELSVPSRAFSKVIHNKFVEKTSDALETTIARPNAMLAGAVMAFLFTLVIYLVAKNYGYRLSGFETIGGFILGWIVGLLFDYFRVMITGKRS